MFNKLAAAVTSTSAAVNKTIDTRIAAFWKSAVISHVNLNANVIATYYALVREGRIGADYPKPVVVQKYEDLVIKARRADPAFA